MIEVIIGAAIGCVITIIAEVIIAWILVIKN